ncbi:MAG: methylated-DNA--[protein]-cysteine S-methyltransferase [Chitinophagia bacterium]|nr:methylated-DNA--[protein]-cysteine S-methyltransferase [Chitinophagia bacterium]
MDHPQHPDFDRVTTAINYLVTHFKEQPALSDVAAEVHLSPAHFQRIFTEWAGTSPRQFLRYISTQHAKAVLHQSRNLFDAAIDTGLSGTGRLHDLFVTIEAMTPGEYRLGGAGLTIHWQVIGTPFGEVMAAATPRGICQMAFLANTNRPATLLQQQFPAATLLEAPNAQLVQLAQFWAKPLDMTTPLRLHVKGTPFQLKVWELLLKIPAGALTAYGQMATALGQPGAARAVGSAVGSNVIQSTGVLGGYMWGTDRKQAILGWEMAKLEAINNK